MCLRQKQCDVFRRWTFVPPIEVVRTENTEPFSGPKKIGPKKKNQKACCYFSLCFCRKQSDFRDFFSLLALGGVPLLGVGTEKNFQA